jgi:hypothetical protein
MLINVNALGKHTAWTAVLGLGQGTRLYYGIMTEKTQDNLDPLASEQLHDGNDGAGPLHVPILRDERMARTERMLGLAEGVAFDDAIAQRLAARPDQAYRAKRRHEVLEAHGITNIDPAAAPDDWQIEKLSDADWETIRNSEHPLLDLWAATNYWRQVGETTFVPVSKSSPRHDDPRRGVEGLENRATMQSLPLLHGLPAEAFVDLVQHGTMQSNRTRYVQGGSDALAFHGAGIGATNLQDRELGLDQQVFFDYGRPAAHHPQQEVTLVLDPSVMETPGVFATEDDIADTLSVEQYMHGLSTGAYFYETALLRICNGVAESGETRSGGGYTGYAIYNTLSGWRTGQDADFNIQGKPTFSTFEVKVPDPPGI